MTLVQTGRKKRNSPALGGLVNQQSLLPDTPLATFQSLEASREIKVELGSIYKVLNTG